MFKIIKKQIRPNTSVQFWQGQNDPAMTDEFRNYFYENYVLTGKFISTTPEVSSDGLELTSTSIWNSESDFFAAMADPAVQQNVRVSAQSHMTANDIANVEVSKETF